MDFLRYRHHFSVGQEAMMCSIAGQVNCIGKLNIEREGLL